MEKETENKIAELQMFEQTMQNILMQKQTIQAQLLETENAISELGKTKQQPFKIIGTVMVAVDKEDLEKDLKEKKDMFELRIKKLEKEEDQFKDKAEELQKELLKKLKK